ncbi:MAG: hypothetical protein AAF798_11710 [Bacteroidota bacterium]
MENTPSKSKLSQWLDELQQESWQLELIISGFVIFLLIGVYDPLIGLEAYLSKVVASADGQDHFLIPYFVLLAAWFCCLINLLIHVFLRGLWISTVGLRYVSGEIDYSQLRLTKRFERYIKRKAGSFDRYIDNLERLCSVIFAFTFLIVFMLISIGLFSIFLQVTMGRFWNYVEESGSESLEWVHNGIAFLLVGSAIIYFIDFVTLGRLKRVKWLSVVYYPIYRLMSWLTLSNIYRPLYYNLVDNKFGRWVGILLVPYLVIAALLSSLTYRGYQYYPDDLDRHPTRLRKAHYADEETYESRRLPVTIPSKYVDNGYLEVFIPYIPIMDDEAVTFVCDSIKPHHEPNFEVDGIISFRDDNPDASPEELLDCLSKLYQVYVNDSLYQDLHYFFEEKGETAQPGLTTIINVSQYGRGEQLLYIDSYRYISSQDTIKARSRARIPFWIE